MKPLNLPAGIARQFMDAVRAYHAESDPQKREAIAVLQLHTLADYMPKARKRLRLSEVKELLEQMREP